MRRLLDTAAIGLSLALLAGCVVVRHDPAAPPPPPPSPPAPMFVHVHTEYCVAYTEMYGCSHADLIWLESRGCTWDEIGIALYLWGGCGRRYSIYEIHRWHYVERTSWHVCFNRAHVDVYGLFVHVDYDPGPPYGRAYGHYRTRTPSDRIVLHDDELLAVHRVHVSTQYYKQPPRDAFVHAKEPQAFHKMVQTEHARQNKVTWEHTPQGRKEAERKPPTDARRLPDPSHGGKPADVKPPADRGRGAIDRGQPGRAAPDRGGPGLVSPPGATPGRGPDDRVQPGRGDPDKGGPGRVSPPGGAPDRGTPGRGHDDRVQPGPGAPDRGGSGHVSPPGATPGRGDAGKGGPSSSDKRGGTKDKDKDDDDKGGGRKK
jgi:hypothetical protein